MLIEILILISAFFTGYLLSYFTKDEIWYMRKFFVWSFVFCLLFLGILVFIDFSLRFVIVMSLLYICIVVLVNLYLSYDEKFVKRGF